MREDLVDHRRLGDEGDDAHHALARRARERVDLEDLLAQRRPPAAGLGRREALVFRRVDALRPFLTSNEGVWAAFEPELCMRLAELDVAARTDQRVRAALLEALPSGLVSMDAVASKLAMSRRTLQRRLAAEETSFIAVVRETRESLARHYLQRTDLAVNEIAFLLGFGEPRSFYRAFRDWTGRSPDQVRRQRSTEPRGTIVSDVGTL